MWYRKNDNEIKVQNYFIFSRVNGSEDKFILEKRPSESFCICGFIGRNKIFRSDPMKDIKTYSNTIVNARTESGLYLNCVNPFNAYKRYRKAIYTYPYCPTFEIEKKDNGQLFLHCKAIESFRFSTHESLTPVHSRIVDQKGNFLKVEYNNFWIFINWGNPKKSISETHDFFTSLGVKEFDNFFYVHELRPNLKPLLKNCNH